MFGSRQPFWHRFAGGTVPNATTFNETLTINKTAEVGIETILTAKVSDDATAQFVLENGSSSANTLVPVFRRVASITSAPIYDTYQGSADTGSTPIAATRIRIGTSTVATTRPLWELQAGGGGSLLSYLPLNSGGNLALSWGTQAAAAPAFTTRSAGVRAVWYSAISGSQVDFATGVGASTQSLYHSVPQANSSYRHAFFGGTTEIASFRGDGRFVTSGARVAKVRVATTTPVTVDAGTDYNVITKLAAPGAVAVNLPAGVAGQVFVIQDGTGDAAANNITITPAAGNINGAGTLVINANYGAKTLTYTGTEWLAY